MSKLKEIKKIKSAYISLLDDEYNIENIIENIIKKTCALEVDSFHVVELKNVAQEIVEHLPVSLEEVVLDNMDDHYPLEAVSYVREDETMMWDVF